LGDLDEIVLRNDVKREEALLDAVDHSG